MKGTVLVLAVLTMLSGAVTPVSREQSRRRSAASLAMVLCALLAIATVVYVMGEDDYLQDGRSTWTVHAKFHVLYVATPVVAGAAAVMSRLAMTKPRIVPCVPLATTIAAVLGWATLATTLE